MSRHTQRNIAGAAVRRHGGTSSTSHRSAAEEHLPAAIGTDGPLGGNGRSGPSTVTIGQFFATLRRRFVLVTVCLLLGVVAGVGLLSHTPKTYQATAVVDISPILGNQNGNSSTNSVSTITESRIAASASVALLAAKAIGFDGTPTQLAQQVTVSSPLASQVLNITFSSSRPQGAANGANAFANAYLAYRTSTGEAELKLRISRINDQVTELQSTLAKLKVPPAGSTDPQFVAQQSLLQNQIQQLQTQMNTYRTSVITPGQVAGAAPVPTSPSSPKLYLYLAGGLLVGLLAGAVLAVVRDRRDDRVRTSDDLHDTLGVPVIAETATAESSSGNPNLVALTAAQGAEADAYRSVTTTVTSDSADRRVVLVCGARRDGRSLVPFNLAATFALQGLTTVIAGPSNALAAAADLLEVRPPARPDSPRLVDRLAHSTAVPQLSVLSLGTEVSLSATLRANGDNLNDVLSRADIIVLDGFNTELPSTTLRLGQIADEAVIVAYRDRATHAELSRLANHLFQVRSTLLGAMLVSRRSGLLRRLRAVRGHRSATVAPVSPAGSTTSGTMTARAAASGSMSTSSMSTGSMSTGSTRAEQSASERTVASHSGRQAASDALQSAPTRTAGEPNGHDDGQATRAGHHESGASTAEADEAGQRTNGARAKAGNGRAGGGVTDATRAEVLEILSAATRRS